MMKHPKLYGAILTFLLFLFLTQNVQALEKSLEEGSPYVKGEIIVDFIDGTTEEEIARVCKKYGIETYSNSLYSRDAKLMLARTGDRNMERLLKKLSREPAVEAAEPNFILQSFGAPNDPLYKYQWNMKKINVEKAWKHSTGKGVTVAVIDTGVAYENYGKFKQLEDLRHTEFISPYNFVDDTVHAGDDNGHGSHVAGTIAQSTNNGKGVCGIAYHAKIMPVKVLAASGSGRLSDIADGIRYAADNGARVINLSLGGPFKSEVLQLACKYAYKKGCVIVCAAGNDGGNRPNYPAAYRECISVSAVRDDNQLAFYSTRGPQIDIAAPGGDMREDYNGDGYNDGILQNTIKNGNPQTDEYVLLQGTSMAAPHVAGTAALLVSAGYTDPKAVKTIMQSSSFTKGLDLKSGYGSGILDAGKALRSRTALYGFLKLALCMGSLVFLRAKTPSWTGKILGSPLFLTGALLGACGLFFLPLLFTAPVPGQEFFCRDVSQWHTAVTGTASPLNILFYSAAPALALMFLSLPLRNMKKLALGLGMGIACAFAGNALTASIDVAFVPQALERLWFAANALILFGFSYASLKLLPEKT